MLRLILIIFLAFLSLNDLKSQNTIVIVPSLALIKQTFNSWAKENISEKLLNDKYEK